MSLKKNLIKIWTDGSCKPNPGHGGIGIIWCYNNQTKEFYQSIGNSTNNVAELTAIKIALQKLNNKSKLTPIQILTDSQYSIGVLSQNWKVNANKELIEEIKNIMKEFKQISFIKIKGHSGNEFNERVDKLAKKGIEENKC